MSGPRKTHVFCPSVTLGRVTQPLARPVLLPALLPRLYGLVFQLVAKRRLPDWKGTLEKELEKVRLLSPLVVRPPLPALPVVVAQPVLQLL